jgi:hypothetical protein
VIPGFLTVADGCSRSILMAKGRDQTKWQFAILKNSINVTVIATVFRI